MESSNNHEVTIRRLKPDEWRRYRDLRLAALADSPDVFGSTLERESAFMDCEWIRRLAEASRSGMDCPLVAEINGQSVGLAWVRIDLADKSAANLYQMWIAPQGRRRGIGRALLNAAIDWAYALNAENLMLRVTCGNSPAKRLYTRAGFRPVGPVEPLRQGSTVLAEGMALDLTGHIPHQHPEKHQRC